MRARSSGPDLKLTVTLDNQILFNDFINEIAEISGSFDDDEGTIHLLTIELSEKLENHTQLNAAGEIVSDRLIELTDIQIDEIDITTVFQFQAKYTHDYNGTKPEITQGFHGLMGCNGTVKLEFKGPVYTWLLENM
jgi:hypothetical protein